MVGGPQVEYLALVVEKPDGKMPSF